MGENETHGRRVRLEELRAVKRKDINWSELGDTIQASRGRSLIVSVAVASGSCEDRGQSEDH